MSKNTDTPQIRCAIYTRKSTGENLDMDFNTLDAQREACELYIRSQESQGWSVVEDHYDDGGFTGANMERPALQRLMDDIESGKVNCVVVYKVDRLSRSLLDFARLIELFDSKGVSFVSTTQQFNTSQSLGRLVLNILLSFAQFEREMISERTRDKMSAARRKGKWIGGPPVLGYRVDRERRRLEVIPEEADQVRVIFKLYLKMRSISAVAKQLDQMNWRTKQFTTKDGRETGGNSWKTNAVHRLLRNKIYIGKVTYKDEVYEGEQEAIVDGDVFDKVQNLLTAKTCGRGERNGRNPEYILTGLLRCRCGESMTTSTGRSRNGNDYRYYVCRNRIAKGPKACDHPRVASAEVEPLILERVRDICADESLRDEISLRLDKGKSTMAEELGQQRVQVQTRIDTLNREARSLLNVIKKSGGKGSRTITERLGELESEMDKFRQEAGRLDDQIRGLTESVGRVATAIELLDSFDDLWDVLIPEERVELLRLLIDHIDVDEPAGKLDLHLHDLAAPFPPIQDAAGAQS